MKLATFIITILIITAGLPALAQDPLFTQYYHSPVYLNPALTGTAKHDLRVSFVNRRQWLNVPSGINHITAAIEKNLPEHDWSLGLGLNRSTEGYLKTTQASLIVAKGINGANFDDNGNDFYINMAVQVGFLQRNADMSKLWFANQINQDGLMMGSRAAIDYLPYAKVFYANITGGVVCTYRQWMLGAAFHRPLSFLNWERTLIDGIAHDSARLPRRITLHLGYIFDTAPDMEGSVKIRPSIIFQQQNSRTFIDAGALMNLGSAPIEIGAWYRYTKGQVATHGVSLGVNILFGQYLQRHSAGSPSDPGDQNFIRFGASYDAEIKGARVGDTGGSFEIGGVYEKQTNEHNYCKPKPPTKKTYPWMFK